MANRFGLESDLGTNSAPKYPTRHNARETKLAETVLNNKNIDDDFQQAIVAGSTDQVDGSAYTGATGEIVALNTGKSILECYQAAVAVAAVVTPYQSADGLEVKPVAAADALEITAGITANSKAAFTIGTAEKFFMEATIKIDTVSSVTELWVGFRKNQAYAADPNGASGYTDVAAFEIEQATDVGRINLVTALNDGGYTLTDTTETDWVNGAEKTLRVEVDGSGNVTFKLNGSVPSATVSYTFDSGDIVIPFIHLDTQTGDPGVSISSLKVGKL